MEFKDYSYDAKHKIFELFLGEILIEIKLFLNSFSIQFQTMVDMKFF